MTGARCVPPGGLPPVRSADSESGLAAPVQAAGYQGRKAPCRGRCASLRGPCSGLVKLRLTGSSGRPIHSQAWPLIRAPTKRRLRAVEDCVAVIARDFPVARVAREWAGAFFAHERMTVNKLQRTSAAEWECLPRQLEALPEKLPALVDFLAAHDEPLSKALVSCAPAARHGPITDASDRPRSRPPTPSSSKRTTPRTRRTRASSVSRHCSVPSMASTPLPSRKVSKTTRPPSPASLTTARVPPARTKRAPLPPSRCRCRSLPSTSHGTSSLTPSRISTGASACSSRTGSCVALSPPCAPHHFDRVASCLTCRDCRSQCSHRRSPTLSRT